MFEYSLVIKNYTYPEPTPIVSLRMNAETNRERLPLSA